MSARTTSASSSRVSFWYFLFIGVPYESGGTQTQQKQPIQMHFTRCRHDAIKDREVNLMRRFSIRASNLFRHVRRYTNRYAHERMGIGRNPVTLHLCLLLKDRKSVV